MCGSAATTDAPPARAITELKLFGCRIVSNSTFRHRLAHFATIRDPDGPVHIERNDGALTSDSKLALNVLTAKDCERIDGDARIFHLISRADVDGCGDVAARGGRSRATPRECCRRDENADADKQEEAEKLARCE